MKFKHDIFECRSLVARAGPCDNLALAKKVIEDASVSNIAYLIGGIIRDYAPRQWLRIEPLGWVALAVSTDKERPHLCKLFVDEEGSLVATDGHRLHALSYKGTPNTWVDPKTGKPCENDNHVFPAYLQLQSVPSYKTTTPIAITDFVPFDIENAGEVWTLPLGPDKFAFFSAQYICDAFGNSRQMMGPYLAEHDPLDVLKLVSLDNKRMAVVMPRRPPKE